MARYKKKSGGTTGSNGTSNTSTNLELHSKLKDVLCTNLCMSSGDVDKLFEQASEN